MSSNAAPPLEPVPQFGAAPPPAKKGCSPGCTNVAFGCAGVILGSLLTIAAEVALVAAGVGWVSEAITRGGYSRSAPSPTEQPRAEPVPTEFNGVDNDTLDSLCNSATLDPKILEGCRQRNEWIREHGGPATP
jgi:hypothetical protein